MTEHITERDFRPESCSLLELFNRPGEGFYVPVYQRKYTWEESNLIELMDDLIFGSKNYLSNGDEITFLGTIIVSRLKEQHRISPSDPKAIPDPTFVVVDGQQRLTTIALIALSIHEEINEIVAVLPNDSSCDRIKTLAENYITDLRFLYALDLKRGEPSEKPKIIREVIDKWTLEGGDDNYQSGAAYLFARFIRTGCSKDALEEIDDYRIRANYKLLREWVGDISNNQNKEESKQFFQLSDLTSERIQRELWNYIDNDIQKSLESEDATKIGTKDFAIASLTQLFLVSHYLLKRCCFVKLSAPTEELGFDMFQSLNATGTPLTALETFLPICIQSEVKASTPWEDSPSQEAWERLDALFEEADTNSVKDTLTNELLVAFALSYDGTKLSNKFSEQKRWLEDNHSSCLDIDEKRIMLDRLASVADFYQNVWKMKNGPNKIIPHLSKEENQEIAFLIAVLRDANNTLAAPILARFYDGVKDDIDGVTDNFVIALKSCVAFFTIWRSSFGTSGLPDVYRKFFSGSKSKDKVKISAHCWKELDGTPRSELLKVYFSKVLENKSLDKESWLLRASTRYTYEVKALCRFGLFIAANDAIPDNKEPGLSKQGVSGVFPTLNYDRWKSGELKSLEHVAPQRPPEVHDWDLDIYSNQSSDNIGNLLLLSIDLNRAAANKNWSIKRLHYAIVGTEDPDEIESIICEAKSEGVNLSKKTITTLQSATFNKHLQPILGREKSDPWDAEFIKKRTNAIINLVWDKMAIWLEK